MFRNGEVCWTAAQQLDHGLQSPYSQFDICFVTFRTDTLVAQSSDFRFKRGNAPSRIGPSRFAQGLSFVSMLRACERSGNLIVFALGDGIEFVVVAAGTIHRKA